MEIFTDIEQNSDAWLRARMGIPTASEFGSILTPGKTKAEQRTRQTYLYKLAGEILTGKVTDGFSTEHTKRGHAFEDEARDLYSFQTGALVSRVGFIKNGRAGCSPDSLVGEDGGAEIKTKLPPLLIELLLKDEFPEKHRAQVQGTLWITKREWWDIVVYWPDLPLFVKRVQRDEPYIQKLATEVDRFNAELDDVVSQIRRRGAAVAA